MNDLAKSFASVSERLAAFEARTEAYQEGMKAEVAQIKIGYHSSLDEIKAIADSANKAAQEARDQKSKTEAFLDRLALALLIVISGLGAHIAIPDKSVAFEALIKYVTSRGS